MPQRDTSDQIIERLENLSNQSLNQFEKDEIEVWNKGRALGFIVNSFGWDVVREMLQSYVTKEIDRLISTDPANRDEVLANHAVAFSASRIYSVFMEDVQRCVEAASRTPESVKAGLRTSPVPPDSL